jgi:hypothetical protein
LCASPLFIYLFASPAAVAATAAAETSCTFSNNARGARRALTKSLAAAISSILFSANLFQLELKKSIIEARALSLFLSQQRSHPMQIQWLLSK